MGTFDFYTPLSQIGKNFTDQWNDGQRQQTLADLGTKMAEPGVDYRALAGSAVGLGERGLGLGLLNLATEQEAQRANAGGFSELGALIGGGGVSGTPMQGLGGMVKAPPSSNAGQPSAPMSANPMPIPSSQAARNEGGMPNLADLGRGYGLTPGYLPAVRQIESGGNDQAVSPTGARGAFQFTGPTAKAYGLTDPNDLNASADATARLARDNAGALRQRLGRDPTDAELYLAHQQGAGGAAALLSNPNMAAVDALAPAYGGDRNKAARAIAVNGGDPNMPAGDFAQIWTSKYDRLANGGRPGPEVMASGILRISDREGHQMIWTPDEHGGFSLASVPNSRHFDYIKRGLDTLIDRNTNEVTGQVNTMGGALVGLKREILGSLDKLNPAYAAARKQYAGETELLNALRDGQKAMAQNTTPEAMRKSLKDLSPGERDLFRLGASNALRDRVANAGDGVNKVRAVYGSPALRAKANALIDNEADRKALHAFLGDEAAMFKTRGEIGGSPTSERMLGAADTDGLISGAGHAAVQAAQGRVGAALRTAFDTIRKVNPELRGKVMNEARQILLNPDPEAVRAFGKRLADAEMKEGTRQRLLSALSAGLPRGMMPGPGGQ